MSIGVINIARHQNSHQTLFECEHCTIKFNRKDSYRRHLELHRKAVKLNVPNDDNLNSLQCPDSVTQLPSEGSYLVFEYNPSEAVCFNVSNFMIYHSYEIINLLEYYMDQNVNITVELCLEVEWSLINTIAYETKIEFLVTKPCHLLVKVDIVDWFLSCQNGFATSISDIRINGKYGFGGVRELKMKVEFDKTIT